ncbi:MAG: hypothetical protein AABX08_02445 [Nanoarchaeota archaeon]
MKVVTARIEDKYLEDIKKIEKEEHTERAEVLRKLLATAIRRYKTKKSLELLKEHKITIRRAAHMADIPYIEMLDLASKADIDIGYTLIDLGRDTS